MNQNYSSEAEAGVNKQINIHLHAMYTYMSMSSSYKRDDVALAGFAEHFRKASAEEMENAQLLMKFQNDRGGRILLQAIEKPAKNHWGSGQAAMKAALELEKNANEALLGLHKIAVEKNDPHMADFIEDNFLRKKVEAIKILGDYITSLERLGPGKGDYYFDEETLQNS